MAKGASSLIRGVRPRGAAAAPSRAAHRIAVPRHPASRGGCARHECGLRSSHPRAARGSSPRPPAALDPTSAAVNVAANVVGEISKGLMPKRRRLEYNGTFLLVLINVVVFGVGLLGVDTSPLALQHWRPQWWQFLTCIFCHGSWQHLSSNLFQLYIFGKLVEEEEGALGVWASYLVCGVCGSAASLLFSPRNAASLGASGAVFGLYAVGVLVRLSFNLRKLVEAAIVGQFVYEQVQREVRMQIGRGGRFARAAGAAGGAVQVSHVAHIAGAAAGVVLILALSRLPAVKRQN